MTHSDNAGGDSPEMSGDGESLLQQNDGVLRKGPWTKEEDEILVRFVKERGIVKWTLIGKQTGLARSGKSCRLRWLNHLRPNLKKGSFTKDEENLIVRLHSEYGNKWTRIASKLPGRTDNEIKNFWNTRVKKCQKRQLPLYPKTIEDDSRVVDANCDYNSRFSINNLCKKFTTETDFDQIVQSSSNAPSETHVSCLHGLSSAPPHLWSPSPMYLPPQSFHAEYSGKQHPLSQPPSTQHHFLSENQPIFTHQPAQIYPQCPSSPGYLSSLQQSKSPYQSMQALLSSHVKPPPTWLSSLLEDNGSLLMHQSSISHSTQPLIKPSISASTPQQYSVMSSLNNKQLSRFKRPGGRLPRPLSAPQISSTPTSKKSFCSTLELNSSNYLSSVTPRNRNSTTQTSTSPTYPLNFPTVGLSDSSLQDSPLSVDMLWPSISRSMIEPISLSSSFVSKMEPPSIQSISAASLKYPSDTNLSQLNTQSMASSNVLGTPFQEELGTEGWQSLRKDDFFGQSLTREGLLTECKKTKDSLDNILSKANAPNEIPTADIMLDKYSIKEGILTQSFKTTDSSDNSLNTENASYQSRRRKEFINISRENNDLHTQVAEEVDILNKTLMPIFLQDGSSRNEYTISEKSEGFLVEDSSKREVNYVTLTEGSQNYDLLVEDITVKDILDTGSTEGCLCKQYDFTKCLNMEDSSLVESFNVGGDFNDELREDLLEEGSSGGLLIESSSIDELVIGESSCRDQLIKIMERHDATDASMSKNIYTLKVNSNKEFLLISSEKYPVADEADLVSSQRHTSFLPDSGGWDVNSSSIRQSAGHIEAEDHIDTEISNFLEYFPTTAEIPIWYNTGQEIPRGKAAI